jgi:Recombination endonuclease VII
MGRWITSAERQDELRILDSAGKRRYKLRHPERVREADRVARIRKQTTNPGYFNAILRKHVWKKKFGLTPEQYDRMFLDRSGCCDICHLPAEKPLHLDHDHTTGLVRGLLCIGCNLKLGWYERLSASILDYLK